MRLVASIVCLCCIVSGVDASTVDRGLLSAFPGSRFSLQPADGTAFKSRPSWTVPSSTHQKKVASISTASSNTTKNKALALALRGGGCSDSDPTLFFKIGLSAALEAALMLGTIAASIKLSDKYPSIPSVFNLPLLELLASFAVIFASSLFGSVVDGSLSVASNQVLSPSVIPGDANWYNKLTKPSWNPPGWVFPIMWLIVSKPTQLCAVSRILKYGISKGKDAVNTKPLAILALYTFHLSMGDAWNKVFFGLQCTGRGAAVISLFFGCLIASAYLFYTVDKQAGYYMLPTIGWVAIATALNWNIYLNNQ